MAHQIEVTKQVFDEMNKCGDWNTTLGVLYDLTGELPIWDEEVHTDLSYQNDNKAVIVGARTCRKTIVTVKK